MKKFLDILEYVIIGLIGILMIICVYNLTGSYTHMIIIRIAITMLHMLVVAAIIMYIATKESRKYK